MYVLQMKLKAIVRNYILSDVMISQRDHFGGRVQWQGIICKIRDLSGTLDILEVLSVETQTEGF